MKGYTIQNSISLLEKAEKGGGSGGASSASDVSYDNTVSGLTADDVQEAIDELNADITTINAKTLSFGTPIMASAEELAAFDTVNDTYTAPATGLLLIDVKPSANQENYFYVTHGANVIKGSSGTGNDYMLTIPVNQGDVLTVNAVLRTVPNYIATYPLTFAAPTVSKKKKGGSK